MKWLIFICGSFSVISVSIALKLPRNFQICQNNDACLSKAIEQALHILCDTGFPEIQLPKLDPIEIKEINIGTKGSAVDIEQNYKDVKVVGLRHAKVRKAHLDRNAKFLTFTVIAPRFKQLSNYDIKGRILIFPIFGKGKSEITQKNVSVTHNIQFEEQNKGGIKYWNIKSYTVDMAPKKITFFFENLLNGNKELSERIHFVVNENWQALWLDSKNDFEDTYGKIYFGFAQRLFSKIPVENIFPS